MVDDDTGRTSDLRINPKHKPRDKHDINHSKRFRLSCSSIFILVAPITMVGFGFGMIAVSATAAAHSDRNGIFPRWLHSNKLNDCAITSSPMVSSLRLPSERQQRPPAVVDGKRRRHSVSSSLRGGSKTILCSNEMMMSGPNRMFRRSARLASSLRDGILSRSSSSQAATMTAAVATTTTSKTTLLSDDEPKPNESEYSGYEYDIDDDDEYHQSKPPKPTKPPKPPPPRPSSPPSTTPSATDSTIQSELTNTLRSQIAPYRLYSLTPRPHPTSHTLSRTTLLTYTNIALYILQTLYPPLTAFGVKRSELILSQPHRLFTPMFLHGSPFHLGFNLVSLGRIGPEAESVFGPGRFMAIYLLSGVGGNVASALGCPNPSLGASGAVFGIMGAYVACVGRNERFFGERASGDVVSTLVMNVVFGRMSRQVDNWAHLGGAVAGAISAIYLGPRLFVMALPSGGRIVVDKPYLQLPPSIESIPSKLTQRLRRGRLRMQVDRYADNISAKPWRDDRWRRSKRRSSSGNGGGGGDESSGVGGGRLGGLGGALRDIGKKGRERRARRARGRRERGMPLDRNMLKPRSMN